MLCYVMYHVLTYTHADSAGRRRRRPALGAVRGPVAPLALGAAGQQRQHESEARSGAPFRGLVRRMQGASQLIYSASLAVPDSLAAPALLHLRLLDPGAVRALSSKTIRKFNILSCGNRPARQLGEC